MPSSSSLSRTLKYDVFPSFCGGDVRKGFLSHVLKEFKSKGITSFIDDEIDRGKRISHELVQAIRQSKVAVVLLSSNYASSSWCLDELAEIMKCRKEDKQTVITIFYRVDPADVRKQTGVFGKAFKKACVGKTKKVKQAWRQALKDVANIAGYDSGRWQNEADMINEIAANITGVLGFTASKDFDDFVGMEPRIAEIKRLFRLPSDEVKMLAIVGPAGIVKTSTARALYNQLSPGFQFSTFIENIRGSTGSPSDSYQSRLDYQKMLLSHIFGTDIKVSHLGRAKEKLGDKKVLVVLDEVDWLWQLEAMANKPDWFGPGSIIIITTEDRKPLIQHGINLIYKMNFPTRKESLQIFCQYAFGQKSPYDGFDELAHIAEIKWLFRLPSDEVKMFGIVGPAGIGKTSTARALYNQLSHGFQFSTFIENIRGSNASPFDSYQSRLDYQKKLLSQIFNQKDIEVSHLGRAKEKLGDKKVLVVLDEVDCLWLLEAMANKLDWFGPGSIIIITTEDRKPLIQHGINLIYEMRYPTKDESLQIFCQYAFGQKSPYDGFDELAREVTHLAGDLPLGLRVMGSYLRGMSRDEWIEALPRLRSSLDRDIESTLRFSYDVLSNKDKDLFLHIACFFVGFEVDRVKIFLANSGMDVNHGLQILAQKSLIYTYHARMECLGMHRLLQQMGQKFVYEESSKEPGKRQFLMDIKEISDLLDKNTGTGTVLGIKLPYSEKEIQISKSAFEGMNNLQFLEFTSDKGIFVRTSIRIPEGLSCFSDKLTLIHWDHCPLRIWPSKFSAEFLVELIMQHSKFEKLWEGIKPLQCLKRMDLSSSVYLKEIPDLTEATSLEELNLRFCQRLLKLTSSIGYATKLTKCTLDHCILLKELPSSIGKLINLEELSLYDCTGLKELRGCADLEKFRDCSSLKKLDLRCTAIEEVPSSSINSNWSCLYRLDMSDCENLKEFPIVPHIIVELDLCNTRIEEIPAWIDKLFRLRRLTMHGCKKLRKISPNISKLKSLKFLGLCICPVSKYVDANKHHPDVFEAAIEYRSELFPSWRLLSDFKIHYILPVCLPAKARSLYLRSYGLNTILDGIRHLSGLIKLDVKGCRMLAALPPLPDSLLSIDAEGCKYLERIDSSVQNPEICLNFAGCLKLNQKARKVIQTSDSKYALLPGEEVPTYFTHRATSGSLTVNLTPGPLPSSFIFKACILLSKGDSLEEEELMMGGVSCSVIGRQNGLTIQYGSNQHRMLCHSDGYGKDHLFIFEDFFCLYLDCPEAKEATFNELVFEFIGHGKIWKVKGCGIRLLFPQCIIDGNADDGDNDDNDGDKDKSDDGDDEDESSEGRHYNNNASWPYSYNNPLWPSPLYLAPPTYPYHGYSYPHAPMMQPGFHGPAPPRSTHEAHFAQGLTTVTPASLHHLLPAQLTHAFNTMVLQDPNDST